MTRPSIITVIIIAVMSAACSTGSNESSRFEAIPEYGWRYNDTLTFIPALQDSVSDIRMVLAIRHTNGYRYSNLWIELSYPDTGTLRHDTINVQLADTYGRWYGRGLGVSYMRTDTLPSRYRLRDSVPVRIRHIMRTDTLKEIEQVGIIFLHD